MINSVWILSYKKNTVFMNFENSKSSDPNKLLLNLPDEMNLKGSDKYVTLSNLNICYTQKNLKKSCIKAISLRYQLQY